MEEADLRQPPDLARAADLTPPRDLHAETCGSLEQRYLGMVAPPKVQCKAMACAPI